MTRFSILVIVVAPVLVLAQSARRPTFAEDVAPIVYANCTSCHRPGQAGPFPLLSYDDVRRRGETIARVTSRREMPPWHATRADGFLEMRDERRLTDRQIATIKTWVEAGMPPGNLARAPLPPSFPTGWPLGIPDLILKFQRPIDVPAAGPDLYKNVALEIDLPEDKWITAVDYQPSARAAVHHALFFIGPAGADVREDDAIPGLGRLLGAGRGPGGRAGGRLGAADEAWGGLGGWVPGVTPRFFPDGIAQPFPKHSDLFLQLHLHPSGRAEREDGSLAIYFAKTPPKRSLTGVQVPPAFGFGVGIDIPAGESRYLVRDSFVLPVDLDAYGARGHAHYLCTQMKLTATLPDGTTQGLLWIADWDFGWQDSYFFKTPLRLPRGTRLDVELVYDNSAANPRNPNSPPGRVRWGRGSLDEMGSMTLLVASPTGADAEALRAAQALHFRQQLLRR